MENHLKILKENGYKITPLRKAILHAFQTKRISFTAERLRAIIRKQIPNVGLQSVYRNLADFARIGITESLSSKSRRASYALCNGVSVHHHHAVCRRCGRAVEVNACGLGGVSKRLKRILRDIQKETGFLIEGHSLELEGLCHACQSIKK